MRRCRKMPSNYLPPMQPILRPDNCLHRGTKNVWSHPITSGFAWSYSLPGKAMPVENNMMMSSCFLFLLSSLRLSLAVSPDAICYQPSGNPNTEPGGYFVCNATAEQSACCGPNDECTSTGLCKNAGDPSSPYYFRTACTDKTWQSPLCPNYCTNSSTAGAIYPFSTI